MFVRDMALLPQSLTMFSRKYNPLKFIGSRETRLIYLLRSSEINMETSKYFLTQQSIRLKPEGIADDFPILLAQLF